MDSVLLNLIYFTRKASLSLKDDGFIYYGMVRRFNTVSILRLHQDLLTSIYCVAINYINNNKMMMINNKRYIIFKI